MPPKRHFCYSRVCVGKGWWGCQARDNVPETCHLNWVLKGQTGVGNVKERRKEKKCQAEESRKSLCEGTEVQKTMMPLYKFHFWRNWPGKGGGLGNTGQSLCWEWAIELKARALKGRLHKKGESSSPDSMFRMPASKLLPPGAEVYSSSVFLTL